MMRKFVVTGGPNSGKSTTIHLLSARGHHVLTESSRLVIEKKGIYPWDDQEVFCEAFRHEQLRRERQLRGELVFLDRSLVDPIAYAEIAGVTLDKSIYKDIDDAMYEREVFFFEMLPDYAMDRQRKDSPEQARAVHERLRAVYTRLRFNVVDVPLFTDDACKSKSLRVEFILKQVIAPHRTHRERKGSGTGKRLSR